MSAVGAAAPGHPAWRSGEHHGHSAVHRLVTVFGILFLVLTGLAVLGAVVGAPAKPKSVCPTHKECVNPPQPTPLPSGPGLSGRLATGKVFVSPTLGYRIEFPSYVGVQSHTPLNVELAPTSGSSFIVMLKGAPADQVTPAQAVASTVSDLRGSIPNLQADTNASTQILSPALGGHAGVGGFYQGNLDSPSGPGSPVDIAVLAATDSHQTIAAAVISTDRSKTDNFFAFVDQNLLDTLRFKGDIPK
jgi:hypothetical protein